MKRKLKFPHPVKKFSSSLDKFGEVPEDGVSKSSIWKYGLIGAVALFLGIVGIILLTYNDKNLENAIGNSLDSLSEGENLIPGLDTEIGGEPEEIEWEPKDEEERVDDIPWSEYHTLDGATFTGRYTPEKENRSKELSAVLNKKYGFPLTKRWLVVDERPGLEFKVVEEGSTEAFTVKFKNGGYWDDVHNKIDIGNQELQDNFTEMWSLPVDIHVGFRPSLSPPDKDLQGIMDRQRKDPAELVVLVRREDGRELANERAEVEAFSLALAKDGSFSKDFPVKVVYYDTYEEYKNLVRDKAFMFAEGNTYMIRTNGTVS